MHVIDIGHPINTRTDGEFAHRSPILLDVTVHQDATYSLRVSGEALRMIADGLAELEAANLRYSREAWTTPEFQEAQAERVRVLRTAIDPATGVK